jgi:hypothetical protein
MKTLKAGWLFTGGALLGLSIALCTGAGVRTNAILKASPMAATTETQPAAWSRLKVVAYPNGATGFFDTETGIMYVYDADLRNCYLMRQLKSLGDPLLPVR